MAGFDEQRSRWSGLAPWSDRAQLLRSVLRGPAMLVVGLVAALKGAGLATGIMWYEAAANGVDYTTESWVLIGPVWAAVGVSWLLLLRWPLVAPVFGGVTAYAIYYFSDVYGQYVGGILLLLSAVVLLAHLPDIEESVRAKNAPGQTVEQQ